MGEVDTWWTRDLEMAERSPKLGTLGHLRHLGHVGHRDNVGHLGHLGHLCLVVGVGFFLPAVTRKDIREPYSPT